MSRFASILLVGIIIGVVLGLAGSWWWEWVGEPTTDPPTDIVIPKAENTVSIVTTTVIAPEPSAPSTTVGITATSSTSSSSTTSPTTTSTTLAVLVKADSVSRSWGETVGLTMFRGNPTRTFYGTGPIPAVAPEVSWRYPENRLCSESTSEGETKQWCGTGWTGQPAVWETSTGAVEVIVGAYDRAVHFIDAHSGTATRPPFVTEDLVKGSVTIDPNQFPLLYFGSRDNQLRILALDRDPPTELWTLDARAVAGIWNDDWDGNPLIVDGLMMIGGENGWVYVIELNRDYDSSGLVSVNPAVIWATPAWDQDTINRVGYNQSIESSVALFENHLYVANSGGKVSGYDLTKVRSGEVETSFEYWVGDDVDASLVMDKDGYLYVAVEEERKTPRSAQLGQIIKLDPSQPADPYLWGVPVPGGENDGGVWATPGLSGGFLYVPTQPGDLLTINTTSGEVTSRERVGWHAWSSPVLADDGLLLATCEPKLRYYRLDDPAQPDLSWEISPFESCVESTPALWEGSIYVGSRDGYIYGFRSP